MFMESFKLDDAMITKNGILFNDLFYSCQRAIREQWYSQNEGGKIRIKYNNSDISEIILIDLQDICRVIIFNLFEAKKLKEFYDLMQIYKESRNKFIQNRTYSGE